MARYEESERDEEAPRLKLRPHRAAPPIERNEPCPCNSGKKFKKCCRKVWINLQNRIGGGRGSNQEV